MGLLDNQTQEAYYSNGDSGNYQFVTLENIISAFTTTYVGEDKIIPKVNRTDIQFHAMRALQELSYDIFRSIKSQEIEVPATLTMMLPQDYVNYVKLVRVGSDGIERILYPTGKTSNPFKPQLDSNKEPLFDVNKNMIPSGNLVKNGNFIGGSENWELNITFNGEGGISNQTTTLADPTEYYQPDTPVEGYYYGFNGNAIGAYNVLQYWGMRQDNIPMIPGEEYKITYTLSDYTGGTWSWLITDEYGNYSATTNITANGTYEETIIAGGGGNSNYVTNSIIFRNTGANDSGVGQGNVTLDSVSLVRVGDEATSTTWGSYKDKTELDTNTSDASDVELDYRGRRYGLDPQHAQSNGTFFIDYNKGYIHFGSSLAGKTITLKYISDGLGTDEEMVVHKFCEEACYKWIAYAILSTRSNIPEYVIQRYKKEKFAETRKAKIRLSNIKIEEFSQILKGIGKQIK